MENFEIFASNLASTMDFEEYGFVEDQFSVAAAQVSYKIVILS